MTSYTDHFGFNAVPFSKDIDDDKLEWDRSTFGSSSSSSSSSSGSSSSSSNLRSNYDQLASDVMASQGRTWLVESARSEWNSSSFPPSITATRHSSPGT